MNPQEFWDRCSSLAMKTVPKVEDPLLQKFHHDQAQRMLLSTFIAGVFGNPGQQLRFQMPATVDEAHQIAVKVFEAEAQEKTIWHFFRILKLTEKVEATLVSPGKLLEDQSMDRLLVIAPTRRMQAGSSVSKTRERMGIPNHMKRESQAALMLKLLVETPIVRKACN